MPTLVHIEGWDHQALLTSAARGGGNAVTNLLNRRLIDAQQQPGLSYDTGIVHHAHTNSASLHSADPGAASNWQFLLSGTSQACVGHLAFRYTTLPNADAAFLIRCIDTSVGTVGHDIQVRPTGALRVAVGGVNKADAGTITTGTWYILEWLAESAGTSHDVTWKVYPAGSPGSPVVAERTDTTTGLTDCQFSECRVGQGTVTLTSVGWYLDDWLLSETAADYPLGESIVKVYTPTGKGTHVDHGCFQNFAGANVTNGSPQNTHLDLDDVPADTTTGVVQVSQDSFAYLEYVMSSTSETSPPLAVGLLGAFSPNGTTTNSANMFITEGVSGSASSAYDASVGTGLLEWHCSLYQTKPSGGAWTAPALQATRPRFGYGAIVSNPPRLAEFYLVAAFALTAGSDAVGGSVSLNTQAFGGTAAVSGSVAVTGGSVNLATRAFGGTANIGGGTTNVSTPSLVAADSGSLEILVGVAGTATSFAPQPSVGWTEKADIVQNLATTPNDQTIFVEYRTVGAGATGAAIGTLATSTAWAAMNLIVTPAPVQLVVTSPSTDIELGGNAGDVYAVVGTAVAPGISVTVTVNGFNAPVGTADEFSSLVTLSLGVNPIVVTATEASGAHRSVTITRTINVTTPGSGSGGGSSEPVPLSDDMLRIQKIIKESGLDPK